MVFTSNHILLNILIERTCSVNSMIFTFLKLMFKRRFFNRDAKIYSIPTNDLSILSFISLQIDISASSLLE